MRWYNTRWGKVIRFPAILIVWPLAAAALALWFIVMFWFELGIKLTIENW